VWRKAVRTGALLAATALTGVGGASDVGAATQLSLSPSAGAAGSTFTVTGSGFAPADVEIRWDSQSGPLLATATGPSFSVAVAVPDDAVPNSHPVLGVVRSGTSVSTSSAAYQVTGAAVTIATTTTTEVATTTAPVRTTAPVAAPTPTTAASSGAGSGGSAATPATSVAAATTSAPDVTPATGVPVIEPPSVRSGVTTGSVTAAPTAPGAGAALAPRSTGQSSGPVHSPALLVLGLAMTLAAAAALAVRNHRRPAPPPDFPYGP
jgi:hypothetical protein